MFVVAAGAASLAAVAAANVCGVMLRAACRSVPQPSLDQVEDAASSSQTSKLILLLLQ